MVINSQLHDFTPRGKGWKRSHYMSGEAELGWNQTEVLCSTVFSVQTKQSKTETYLFKSFKMLIYGTRYITSPLEKSIDTVQSLNSGWQKSENVNDWHFSRAQGSTIVCKSAPMPESSYRICSRKKQLHKLILHCSANRQEIYQTEGLLWF